MSILNYIKETKAEMSHVSWPTKKQAIVFTVAVIVFSFAVAFYLGAFDALFTSLLEKVLG